jgi:hypothetical protein
VNYFYEPQKYTIALYEKRGRSYREVGIFFESEVTPEEAFDLFREMSNAIPTWQAVEHALEVKDTENVIPEYEVRLIDQRRVLATVLWDEKTMTEILENTSAKTVHKMTIEVELFEDEQEEDPYEWDWNELIITERINVVEINPPLSVMVKEEISEGEKNEGI